MYTKQVLHSYYEIDSMDYTHHTYKVVVGEQFAVEIINDYQIAIHTDTSQSVTLLLKHSSLSSAVYCQVSVNHPGNPLCDEHMYKPLIWSVSKLLWLFIC